MGMENMKGRMPCSGEIAQKPSPVGETSMCNYSTNNRVAASHTAGQR